MNDANIKLQEALFFIELLEAIEKRQDSLTDIATLEVEASFIFSAILNSFYSVTEYVDKHIKIANGKEKQKEKSKEVKDFMDNFNLFYKYGIGLRHVTVHIKHVEVDYVGYLPQKARLNFKKQPKLIREKNNSCRGKLSFIPYFYVKANNDLERMTDLCYEHYNQLRMFVEKALGTT